MDGYMYTYGDWSYTYASTRIIYTLYIKYYRYILDVFFPFFFFFFLNAQQTIIHIYFRIYSCPEVESYKRSSTILFFFFTLFYRPLPTTVHRGTSVPRTLFFMSSYVAFLFSHQTVVSLGNMPGISSYAFTPSFLRLFVCSTFYAVTCWR